MSAVRIFFANPALITYAGEYIPRKERAFVLATSKAMKQGLEKVDLTESTRILTLLSSSPYAEITLAAQAALQGASRNVVSKKVSDEFAVGFISYKLWTREMGVGGAKDDRTRSPEQMVHFMELIAEQRAAHLCAFAEWLSRTPEGEGSDGIKTFLQGLPLILSIKERANRIRAFLNPEIFPEHAEHMTQFAEYFASLPEGNVSWGIQQVLKHAPSDKKEKAKSILEWMKGNSREGKRAEFILQFADWFALMPQGQVRGGMQNFLQRLPATLSSEEKAERIRGWIIDSREAPRPLPSIRNTIDACKHLITSGFAIEIFDLYENNDQINNVIFELYNQYSRFFDFQFCQTLLQRGVLLHQSEDDILRLISYLCDLQRPRCVRETIYSLIKTKKLESFDSSEFCYLLEMLSKEYPGLIHKILRTSSPSGVLGRRIPFSFLNELVPKIDHISPVVLKIIWRNVKFFQKLEHGTAKNLYLTAVLILEKNPTIANEIFQYLRQSPFAYVKDSYSKVQKLKKIAAMEQVWYLNKNPPEVPCYIYKWPLNKLPNTWSNPIWKFEYQSRVKYAKVRSASVGVFHAADRFWRGTM